jgi:uncharacterized ferritin-like protein (DUF455 family)
MSLHDATTVEGWVRAYIESRDMSEKRMPPLRPSTWQEAPAPLRIASPGRPDVWTKTARVKKLRGAFANPVRRAEAVHRMMGHELQAAELLGYALLAFPETPLAFRKGLLGVMDDEIRHLDLYAQYLESNGYSTFDFPTRDWFWERIPSVQSPAEFCATMGMGFEGGNLDHACRFERAFTDAGDTQGAELIRTVHREEIPHVRFAMHWFAKFRGEVSFEDWRAHLPAPLSPWVMKGAPLDREGRARAGFDSAFMDSLEQWSMA